MPRWASRITLEITGVRVESLWDISMSDVAAEGILIADPQGAAHEFIDLWDRINLKRGYPWDSNPQVWVIEFRKYEVRL